MTDPAGPGATAPRGHRAYRFVQRRLPPSGARGLGALAKSVRELRVVVRLSKRRALRRVHLGIRRTHRRLEQSLHRLGWDLGAGTGPESAPVGSRWGTRLRRWLLPPALRLPGTGPVTLLDGRGRPSEDIVVQMHRFGERVVVVVDDPDIGPLRSAGVPYEFAPAHSDVPADTRLRWIVDAYGVDHIVKL